MAIKSLINFIVTVQVRFYCEDLTDVSDNMLKLTHDHFFIIKCVEF